MSTSSEHDYELNDGAETEDSVSESGSEPLPEEEQEPEDNPAEHPVHENAPGVAAERMNRNIVLRDFFRLLAGPRLNVQETAADNSELVNILKELNVVRRCARRGGLRVLKSGRALSLVNESKGRC